MNEDIENGSWSLTKLICVVLGVFTGLFVLCMLYSAVYVVEETQRGVVLTGGQLTEIVEPGLHLRMPIYQQVRMISTETWTDSFAKLSAYSNDGQVADMRVSVTWAANPAAIKDLYIRFKNLDNVTSRYINVETPTVLENTFGKVTAKDAIATRDVLVSTFLHNMQKTVPEGIIIRSVQIENIDFSKKYEQSIEDSMLAEQRKITETKNEEAQVIVNRVKVSKSVADADAEYNKALGEAKGIQARGEAEAAAIRAKAAALRDNPNLVELTKAERWDGKAPTTMVPGSAIPIVNLK